MADADLTTITSGLLMAVWMGVAGWAIWAGLAMQRRARRKLRQSSRLNLLLESAPAIPLVVRVDGRAEVPEKLRQWLGLRREVRHLNDLCEAEDAGIAEADMKLLAEDVRIAQRSGKPFSRALRIAGSNRAMRVEGSLADAKLYPNAAVLLWFFDATTSENAIAALESDLGEARSAFDSLSRLIERAPMPMWYRGDDMNLLLVNGAYVHAVGARQADQVIEEGMELVEAIDGLSPQAVAAHACDAAQPTERLVPATINGQRRQLRIVDVPLGNGGVAGFAIDEQELADIKAELARFELAQRAMLDSLSAAVAEFGADRTLTFTNLPFRRLFGLADSRDVAGVEFDRLLDQMRDAGRLPEVRDFPGWRAERVAWFHAPHGVEESWHLPDGTHLRILVQPVPDGGLLMVAEDQTEQVQLAKARDTLLRVRTASFDNLFEAVAVLGPDGRFNLWNRKFIELWGLEDDALDDHPRLDAFMEKMGGRLRKSGQVSVLLERVRAVNNHRKQKGGQIEMADGRSFHFAAIPLPDGNILFTMLDVSDSRRAEEALRERNEALMEADAIKGRFLSNMAYELRTPLTSIGGFAELLAAGIGGPLPDQAHDYVGAIMQAVDRLTGQINTVLDFTQSEAGALPIAKAPNDVCALLNELVASHGDAAAAAQIELTLDCRDNAGRLECDAKRLKQALAHLLDNALRYTGAGGRVLLFADGRMGKVRIVVSDNGPGMDNRMQARVFDGFARAQGGEGAHGLGLPLARKLVEAHGGTLELLSEPGQGTAITIELPRK